MKSAALDDLIPKGLSFPVERWRTVVAIALLGPFVVMTLAFSVGLIWRLVAGESRHAPACYTMGGGPLARSNRLFDRDSHDIVEMQTTRGRAVAEVIAAIRDCRPGACNATQRTDFRKAATDYVSDRAWTAQRMFVRHGDGGLSFAEAIYGTSVDAQIVEALRAGFAAGLLDISRLHSIEQPMRMLLFRPIAEFKLCRAQ